MAGLKITMCTYLTSTQQPRNRSSGSGEILLVYAYADKKNVYFL